MVNKRAQLKIQQMAFMLIAVTIFFVLVGMFVLIFRFTGLRESSAALEEKNALLLVTRLANSPEFSCEEAFGLKVNCVDLDKFKALQSSADKYVGFWGGGISNIVLRVSGEEMDLLQGAKGREQGNFVSVCEKADSDQGIYDKCEIGRLILYYEG